MATVDRIHIFGASGSGTSTLGAALSERFGYAHLDTDSFFWEPTDPPYRQLREVDARRRMLGEALDGSSRWVLTGSLCGWGDIFIPRFELAVFLFVPHEMRMARLIARERRRFGAAIEPGGPQYQQYRDFIAWAEKYDTADESMRSLRLHQRWLAALPCTTVRIDGPLAVDEQILPLLNFLNGQS